MNIQETQGRPNAVDTTRSTNTAETAKPKSTGASPFVPSTDSKYAIDKATGLLQVIVSERITDEVIRKIPEDEYLKLLSLLDDMISGSINNEV